MIVPSGGWIFIAICPLLLLQNLNNILIDLPGLLVGEFVNREGSHDGLGTVTRFRVANIDQESINIRQLRSAF
jgi:hypothetical protein